MLVALKCDLREAGTAGEGDGDETGDGGDGGGGGAGEKVMIDYKQGLECAKRIQALRYLGEFGIFCSGDAKRPGWNELTW